MRLFFFLELHPPVRTQLARLEAGLQSQVRWAEIEGYAGPFSTLASLLGGAPLAPLRASIENLTLMESELRPEGPRYTPRVRWPLGG